MVLRGHQTLGLCSVEGHGTRAQEVPLMAWGLLFQYLGLLMPV